MRLIQELGSFVHGALASLHLLGFFYNLKRGNKIDALIHGSVFVYDVSCAVTHAKEARK